MHKNGPNKTNHPSKEAILTSFEGRILCIIFGTSYFATGSYLSGVRCVDGSLYWIFAEQSGGYAYMLLETVAEILFAIVAGRIRDLSY